VQPCLDAAREPSGVHAISSPGGAVATRVRP
jgi:hypothetical protein